MTSGETSCNTPANHFAGAGKMVELISQSQREANESLSSK